MPQLLSDATFTFGYDPYERAAELAKDAATAERFREIVEAAGLTLEDSSDRDILYSVSIADEARALSLLDALLAAGVVVQFEAERGDAAAIARVNAILAANGQKADFDIDRGPTPAQVAEAKADQANMQLLRRTLESIERTGLIRALATEGWGWADEKAVHPSGGEMPLITLDADGRKIWGCDTNWTSLLRVETADGAQGWLEFNGMGRGALHLDGGLVIDRYSLGRPWPKPIAFTAPAGHGAAIKRSITIPVTLEMEVSAAQTEAEAERSMRAVLKEVVRVGMKLGSARQVTFALDGKRIGPGA